MGPKEEILDLDTVKVIQSQHEAVKPACLIGKLCSHKPVNIFALMDVLKKAFRSKGKLSARDWGNGLIIFTFENGEDREWVIRNQPWHFDGFLFAIQALTGVEQPSSILISKATFWVRVYDLPLLCQNEKVILSIAGRVGTLNVMKCHWS